MRKPIALRPLLLALPLCLVACEFLDSATETLALAKVRFSEGSPAVDGQNVDYSGSLLTPSLDKFVFKMVFHVKADNSANNGKAVFGSDALKPILNFHINSRGATPITTPIPAFSVDAKSVQDLQFPISIPITAIDKATIRKIINGDAIPYFLSGTLQFDLFDGTTFKEKGKTEVDLSSGEISTRPSGTVVTLLNSLL